MEIYVNNELVRRTSIVQKSIYVSDLKPALYEIRVAKEGMHPWNKMLEVFPEIVTEARSFLVRSKPLLVEVPRYFDAQRGIATSSARSDYVKNPEFEALNILFLPPAVKTIPIGKATTSPDKTLIGLLIKNEAGKLLVTWAGSKDSIPNYFCESDVCKSMITISTASRILSFDFFPGRDDLLLLQLENGIYVSEIDDRSPQNVMPIVSGLGYDFKVKDGRIYIKKDGKIYLVSV